SSLSRYCCRRRAAPSVPIQTYHRPVYNGGWNHEYGGYGDEPRRKREDNNKPNHVLLFTIINPVYPITVEVLHTISAPSGQVQRIVIFKKNGVQAMVEYPFQYIFYYMESATRAKETLHGADIYSGCCTLKIDFAKPTKLNVYKNDAESWDYTTPTLGESISPFLFHLPQFFFYFLLLVLCTCNFITHHSPRVSRHASAIDSMKVQNRTSLLFRMSLIFFNTNQHNLKSLNF
ncbi:HNRPL protein, partial [Acromyrmex heyeri]